MTSGLSRVTGLFAFCSVVAMLVGSGAVAHADGLPRGGSCCADLEERVAELEATTARKGNRKVSLTISGQVTTALMAWDNGIDSDVYIVDPPNVGGTLFNLNGSAKISPSLSAGFHIQVGLDRGARSHQVSETNDDGASGTNGTGDTTMVMTLANWYLDHKSLGRVTVGRINTATAGITGIDLGGAGVIANVNVGYWQRSFSLTEGGISWTPSTWDGILGGANVNGSTLSRANAISYTSPTFGGFSVSAAWGEDDIWDAALRYAGEFGGFRVAAGVGYIYNSGGTNEIIKDDAAGPESAMWKGSASVLHIATGLFLTGAIIDRDKDNGAPNTRLYYGQGGIAKNWTGLGNTVLYGEYSRVEDGLAGTDFFGGFVTSSRADVWGLGVVQHIDAAAMELFLSYRRYSAELTDDAGGLHTHQFNDFDVVMSGARIRF
jgi:predicted porin